MEYIRPKGFDLAWQIVMEQYKQIVYDQQSLCQVIFCNSAFLCLRLIKQIDIMLTLNLSKHTLNGYPLQKPQATCRRIWCQPQNISANAETTQLGRAAWLAHT